jgi:hypothetical protein
MEHLSSKTVKELKEYAAENNVDLGKARTKTQILSVLLGGEASISAESFEEQTVIKANEPVKRIPTSSSASNENGVVVSRGANRPKKEGIEIQKEEVVKVALFSEKNLHWLGVGNIRPGYNIVTEEASRLWLTRRGVREATPQEVATYYGKS